MEQLLPYVTFACVAALAIAYAAARQRRERRDTERRDLLRQEGLHLPASLHPVIDTNLCIGSLACVQACPEGDILGIVNGTATLVAGANCIGHGRCATECPVDAIKLVFGSSERGLDLPEVDEAFESSRRGIHIVGELSGMGLIKNAMTQGVELGAYLGRTIPRDDTSLDVVVVGAGPAGLATGLALRAAGRSFQILEREAFGGTIAAYPRHKVVMTERVTLPIHGKFGEPTISKEELIAELERMRERARLPISTGIKVSSVEGSDGEFTVHTDQGTAFRAKKVVLATGRRGSPRKLGIPGEGSPHVVYNLVDAEQYSGRRVVVVGGGDSALEAALSVADAGATVAISYRSASFTRCRAENREKMAGAVAGGRVTALMGSELTRIHGATLDRGAFVEVRSGDRVTEVDADFVIVSIGGELPQAFLEALEIKVRRFTGEGRTQHGSSEKLVGIGRKARRTEREDRGRSRKLGAALFVLGVAVLVGLAWMGADYYLLDAESRDTHPRHDFLRSSGPWGHGVGIVATAFMMSNFLYAMRKRLGFMKGRGRIKTWLTFHVFVGTMSPLVIAFHAAFESKNQLATATAIALLVVAGTGLVGRYVFGLLPSREGRLIDLFELRERFELLRADLSEEHAQRLGAVARQALADPPAGAPLTELVRAPLDGIRLRLARVTSRGVLEPEMWDSLFEARSLRVSIAFHRTLRRVLGIWRALHVVLAVFLVLTISVHVALSIYLGYAWLLTE
ncbi:MAG: NAD(P)-binding domain-containing protein [Deltaproteobacteria bacterium]|nr:NAD(P)-binding domain-containing protein [Deltaproteobacteria bacterium]